MTCFGCKYLAQSGDGVDACLRFGIDGPEDPNPRILIDYPPEPLFEDCFRASSEPTSPVKTAHSKRLSQ